MGNGYRPFVGFHSWVCVHCLSSRKKRSSTRLSRRRANVRASRGRRVVLSRFYRADGLTRHPGKRGELLLGEALLSACDLEAVAKAEYGHGCFLSSKSIQLPGKCQVYFAKRQETLRSDRFSWARSCFSAEML